jgi:hypothetical protein
MAALAGILADCRASKKPILIPTPCFTPVYPSAASRLSPASAFPGNSSAGSLAASLPACGKRASCEGRIHRQYFAQKGGLGIRFDERKKLG